jgi:fibronectin type 3 domain-containing protein
MKLLKLLIPAIALFVVAAFGLTGCGGGGGGGGTTPPPVVDTSVPAAPTNVTAVAGNGQVTVSWTAVTGATSYNIYWANITGVTKANGNQVLGVANPYLHTGLLSGADYFYIVTAVNSNGESVASTQVTAHTNALPAAPTITAATPGNAAVTLTWGNVANATKYSVYYSTLPDVSPLTNEGSVANATSGLTISPLANGIPVYFVVTATVGGVESSASATVGATPAANPAPAAPAGVTATSLNFGNATQYRIQWTAVPGATSYNIYYSTFAGVSTSNTQGATNVATLSKLLTLPLGTYYFVVTAVSANGESAVSNEANVQPPLFTDSLVSGKTIVYTDATGTFSFLAKVDGTITINSSTVPGIATGAGTWNTTGGLLSVVIQPTPTNVNYLMISLIGNTASATMNLNGVDSAAAGTITIN